MSFAQNADENLIRVKEKTPFIFKVIIKYVILEKEKGRFLFPTNFFAKAYMDTKFIIDTTEIYINDELFKVKI